MFLSYREVSFLGKRILGSVGFLFISIYIKKFWIELLPGSIGYLAYRSVRHNFEALHYHFGSAYCACTIFSRHPVTEGQCYLFLTPVWCSVGKLSTSSIFGPVQDLPLVAGTY